MQREGFRVTQAFEADHWWFVVRRRLVMRHVAAAAARLAHAPRPLRLLDFGCGTGFNLPFLARFGDVVGADVATPEWAAVQRDDLFPRLDLSQEHPSHLGRYHILTALDVLEHVDDDVAGLRKMLDLLSPEGEAILTVPAYSWLWGGEDEISAHRRRYTRRTLLAACRAAGAEVKFVSYFNLIILPPMAAVVWMRRLFDADWRRRSNLSPTRPWLNRVLIAVTGAEADLAASARLALPAGAGLICRVGPARPAPNTTGAAASGPGVGRAQARGSTPIDQRRLEQSRAARGATPRALAV